MSGFKPAALLLLIFLFPSVLQASTKVILLSVKNRVQISSNDGKTWKDFNRGLPGNLVPTGISTDISGNLYLLSLDSGLYRASPPYTAWVSLNSGEFRTRRTSGDPGAFRKISAFAACAANPLFLAAATKHALYRSRDGGASWTALDLGAQEQTHYFTSLAFGGNPAELYTGTSFSGLFKINGSRLVPSSSGLPKEPYSKSFSFSEEISSLAIDPKKPGMLYAGLNFGGGLYSSGDAGKSWKAVNLPSQGKNSHTIYGIAAAKDGMYVSTDRGIYRMDRTSTAWAVMKFDTLAGRVPSGSGFVLALVIDESGKIPPLLLYPNSPASGYAGKNRIKAHNRRAIYSSISAVTRKLPSLISTIRTCGFNAIVIDMKDDTGNIFFPTSNSTAREIGAARKPVKLKAILGTLKKEGIYTIARMVVFKDVVLFRAYNSRYAIWDGATNSPWEGSGRERWVDPHSQFVQEYNISLAHELEQQGFDEIQFDYIRFPSDGPTNRCVYRFRENRDMFKSEVLSDFLFRAKKSIRIPLAVDVYGFTVWYRFGNTIGQDIEEFARFTDVLCPMVYPSHFGARFYRGLNGNLHPYTIVLESGVRSKLMAGNGTIIRPYLQAFKMLSPTWGPEYIQAQVQGALEGGSSGYIFWNAGGEYSTVVKAYRK